MVESSSETAATAASPQSPHPGATSGRIIRDDHYRAHRRIRARVEHVIARLKHWQLLRQCPRRAETINPTLQIIAGLWNLKTHRQLRVNP